MRIELNSIKESLLTTGQSVVDKVHLLVDMSEMKEYYQDMPEDVPDGMKDYLNEMKEGGDFNYMEFAVHYIGSLVGKQLSYSVEDDSKFITLKVIENGRGNQ